HVYSPVRSEKERFERGGAVLVDRRIRMLRRMELENDVDGLRGHARLGNERIEGDDLLLFQTGLRDQIVKLNPEHDFALRAQLQAEFLRHRGQALRLIKRLSKQLSQLRVNRLRIIVTQKTEARVDLFLQQNTVCFGETRQHLNQQGQQVWPLRDTG